MPDQTLGDMFERRKSSLKTERSSFIEQYQDLAEFVQPRRGRFYTGDHNKGDRRWNKIINSAATRALRIARAGIIAGTMSPSQQSFSYETPNPDVNAVHAVKVYLAQLALINNTILVESNLYNMVPSMIGEWLLFGTGCMSHVDDFHDVARFYTHTVGSYMIGQNERFEVDTLVREYEQQCSQMVAQYGYKNCSLSVRTAYDRGNYDAWFPVTHFAGPNALYNPGKKNSKFKLFGSTYYEPGEVSSERFLQQKGYDEFPAYVARWDVTGEDVYATDCPGMTALGDVRGLQIEERRKAQAIDKMVSPPLKGPASLRGAAIGNVPGGVTLYDADASREGLSPVYTVNPQLQELRLDMKATEDRIDDSFYVPLFKAISDMEGVQPRNQLELKQRDQERLLQLGDPLQRFYIEFLNKMHDRLIRRGFQVGIYPPPPKELQGQNLAPRYIGPLAMAQRTMQAQSIERWTTFVTGLAQANPGAAQKIDVDATVEHYADIVGVPPQLVVPDDVLAAQREAEQKAQANQQTVAAVGQMADAADKGTRAMKQMGETPTTGATPNGPTALSGLITAIQQRQKTNAFQAPPQR